MLPDELVLAISQQWPCRELQIRQLAYLLCSSSIPSPPAFIVHGTKASGKSSILKALLKTYAESKANEHVIYTSTAKKGKKRTAENGNGDDNGSTVKRLRYAIVRVAECISSRHLLMKIVSSTISAMEEGVPGLAGDQSNSEWIQVVENARCDHVSSLPEVLREILAKARCKKFVLVLDGVDELREGGQMLLAALGRMGNMLPSLSTVFVSKLTPRPLLLHVSGVPHINFPPYTRSEILSILSVFPLPDLPGLSDEAVAKLYPPFLSTLYDSLISPTAGTVTAFQSACKKLWPHFVAPLVKGESPPGAAHGAEWDFPRLLVKNRGLFQRHGENLLIHHIIPDDSMPATTTDNQFATQVTSSSTKRKLNPLPSLPYQPTVVLSAAFLAAYIPPRLDMVVFSKFTPSRNKRRGRKRVNMAPSRSNNNDPAEGEDTTATPSKSKKLRGVTKTPKSTNKPTATPSIRKGETTLLNPRPFPLERLLAIYRAIDPNPPLTTSASLADTIYPELATLQRLRLLVPFSSVTASSGGIVDGSEKWCLNVNTMISSSNSIGGEWIIEMARGIGIEIEEYLGLD